MNPYDHPMHGDNATESPDTAAQIGRLLANDADEAESGQAEAIFAARIRPLALLGSAIDEADDASTASEAARILVNAIEAAIAHALRETGVKCNHFFLQSESDGRSRCSKCGRLQSEVGEPQVEPSGRLLTSLPDPTATERMV